MSIVTYNNRSIANISAVPGAAKSLTHIKTLTASSSSTLSFVDGSDDVVLDSTYPIYLFKFINIHTSADAAFSFNLSADTGSNYNVTKTTTFFRARHREDGSNGALTYDPGGDDIAQGTGFQNIATVMGTDNDQSASGTLMLFNPSSTTFVKHFLATTNTYRSSDYSAEEFTGGYGNTTSAVDAVQFKMNSGNIDAGTIKLYGIKDS
tara:strand:+ start:532 stop:1152 length:621 start_codon:yes stop_codon:yes gene_type:complete